MQAERVAGFRDYIADVQSGAFPGPEHVINVNKEIVDEFLERLDKEPQ